MEKIVLQSQDHLYFITNEEVIYCKADDCYTHVFLTSGQSILISKTLGKFSQLLDASTFIRVSQSCLINKNYIKILDKKRKIIEMDGDVVVRYTLSVKHLLQRFKELV